MERDMKGSLQAVQKGFVPKNSGWEPWEPGPVLWSPGGSSKESFVLRTPGEEKDRELLPGEHPDGKGERDEVGTGLGLGVTLAQREQDLLSQARLSGWDWSCS